MTEAVFNFRSISEIANLRALEGRPQNEVPEASEKVVEGKPVGNDDGGFLVSGTVVLSPSHTHTLTIAELPSHSHGFFGALFGQQNLEA
jgi:microcystin-dependent protein